MKTTIEDFIGVFEGAFSPEYCNTVMEKMETAFKMGYGHNRQEEQNIQKHHKDDLHLYSSCVINSNAVFGEELSAEFNKVFWADCYPQYSAEFSILHDLPEHTIYGSKLQKTDVGQGYHVWHCEHANGRDANRLLAYILYLNDVEEGGETEFLYQHKRFQPKQGTLVIWPAGFTHTHRGNPPLSNTKYILTGWVEY